VNLTPANPSRRECRDPRQPGAEPRRPGPRRPVAAEGRGGVHRLPSGRLPVGGRSRSRRWWRWFEPAPTSSRSAFPTPTRSWDGPLIQRATEAALEGGSRVDDVFTAVRAIADAGAAAYVMTYWNLVLKRGVERFAADLAAAGGSGLITPDLIPDEAGEWLTASDAHGLDRVFLVAPSSTPERLTVATGACRGFVYAASTMGVTGTRETVGSAAQDVVRRTREVTDVPVCVGLGVSTRAPGRGRRGVRRRGHRRLGARARLGGGRHTGDGSPHPRVGGRGPRGPAVTRERRAGPAGNPVAARPRRRDPRRRGRSR
jgi:hypothetical protein